MIHYIIKKDTELRRSFPCGLLPFLDVRKKLGKNPSKSVDKAAGVWYYT